MVNSYFDRYGNNRIENITALSSNFSDISVGHDGMFGSALDFATFIEALFKGNLITNNSLQEMMVWKNPSPGDGRGRYGLGIFNRRTPFGDSIGHRGGGIGSALDDRYFPKKDVTIVWCGNYNDFFDSPMSESMNNFDREVETIAYQ